MRVGSIAELFQDKKYGLIRTEDGEEIHFHEHCMWDTKFKDLKKGQKVEFETQRTYNGFLGFEIRRAPVNK